jgi:hypothetical protein
MAQEIKFRLQVEGPSISRQDKILKQKLIIGRDSEKNMLTLPHKALSRQHAQLECTETGCWLTDLNSAIGTIVNGRKLSPGVPVLLSNGDVIKIGPYTLTIKYWSLDVEPAQVTIPLDMDCTEPEDLTEFLPPLLNMEPEEVTNLPLGYESGLKLRLDVAVNKKVRVRQWFVLAVVVRQLSSPILAIEDLKRVRSGDVQVYWPKKQTYIRLRVQVNAPDCITKGNDAHSFRLYQRQDSPIVEFLLAPERPGEIIIVVTVYQEDDLLGSVRLNTIVQERIAGEVEVKVRSEHIHEAFQDSGKTSLAALKFNLRVDDIKNQIAVQFRRLNRLKLKKARLGFSADVSLEMEIEDIEESIADLQALLNQLKDAKASTSL